MTGVARLRDRRVRPEPGSSRPLIAIAKAVDHPCPLTMYTGMSIRRKKKSADPWMMLAIAAMLIVSGVAILFSAGVEHAILFSFRPLKAHGIPLWLPAHAYHITMPLLIAVSHRVVLQRASLHAGARGVLTLLAGVSVASVWLTDLPLRDRWLTLFHCAVLVFVMLPGRIYPLSWKKFSLVAVAGGLVASISYGAIWGEIRCDQPTPVRCLENTGLRVWIPAVFTELGLPAFAELRNADLRGLTLIGRDLQYADFSGSDLSGANLSCANLRRARLEGVRAAESNWQSAYLDGATMARADLRNADMRDVHAYRLDLSAADLRHSDLRRASLSHTYLAAAKFDGARLQGAYLRFAEGLSTAQLVRTCADRFTLVPKRISVPICRGP